MAGSGDNLLDPCPARQNWIADSFCYGFDSRSGAGFFIWPACFELGDSLQFYLGILPAGTYVGGLATSYLSCGDAELSTARCPRRDPAVIARKFQLVKFLNPPGQWACLALGFSGTAMAAKALY